MEREEKRFNGWSWEDAAGKTPALWVTLRPDTPLFPIEIAANEQIQITAATAREVAEYLIQLADKIDNR